MGFILLLVKHLRSMKISPTTSRTRTRTRKVKAAAAVGLAALAFVAPPPQGFSVQDLAANMVNNGSKFESIRQAVAPLIAQVFFVMFSAAMLGLAQLVYTHFTKKWESRGLPILPINALRPVQGTMSGQVAWTPGATAASSYPGATVPLGGQQRQAQQPTAGTVPGVKVSIIDEYKD